MEQIVSIRDGVYKRYDPVGSPAAVVIDVSRSGREYPAAFRSALSFNELHDNISMYVDEFFAIAPRYGATLLQACFPNTFIDPNRALDDIDPALLADDWPRPLRQSPAGTRGLGLIKSTSRYGTPLQDHLLTNAEINERISRYYTPYTAELGRIVRSVRREFGYVLQVTCHCMSAQGMPTHGDAGGSRADFCLGDMDGKTCRPDVIELVESVLQNAGYAVSINTPYNGGPLIERNADPARNIDGLMIEINKRLFMDIDTFEKTAGFESVREVIEHVIEACVDYSQWRREEVAGVGSR